VGNFLKGIRLDKSKSNELALQSALAFEFLRSIHDVPEEILIKAGLIQVPISNSSLAAIDTTNKENSVPLIPENVVAAAQSVLSKRYNPNHVTVAGVEETFAENNEGTFPSSFSQERTLETINALTPVKPILEIQFPNKHTLKFAGLNIVPGKPILPSALVGAVMRDAAQYGENSVFGKLKGFERIYKDNSWQVVEVGQVDAKDEMNLAKGNSLTVINQATPEDLITMFNLYQEARKRGNETVTMSPLNTEVGFNETLKDVVVNSPANSPLRNAAAGIQRAIADSSLTLVYVDEGEFTQLVDNGLNQTSSPIDISYALANLIKNLVVQKISIDTISIVSTPSQELTAQNLAKALQGNELTRRLLNSFVVNIFYLVPIEKEGGVEGEAVLYLLSTKQA